MKRLAGLGAGGAIILLAAALGWGLFHPANGRDTQVVGHPAPDFQLRPLGGGAPLRLSSYRGQPVVVNFWASWCASCRDEAGVLKSAATRLRGRVQFLGVDIQDSVPAARADQQRVQFPYPLGTVEEQMVSVYGVSAPPQSFFIDRQGVVVAREAGPLDDQALLRYLQLTGA